MKVFSALLLVCLSAYAAVQMEVEKRVPATLSHLAQIKEKDPRKLAPVRGTNGDVVAQISKIVLDSEGQRPKFAVLYLFDQVAQNRPLIVVPWETLTVNTNTSDLFVDVSLDKLRQAEPVRVDDVPDRAPADWGTQYYAFYGVQPRQNDPEPNAVGTAAAFSGVSKGFGSDREAPHPARPHRGLVVYLSVTLLLVIFALTMLSRRRRAPEAR